MNLQVARIPQVLYDTGEIGIGMGWNFLTCGLPVLNPI